MATLCVPDTWPEVQNFGGLADWPLRKSAFKFMISQLWWPRNEQTTGAADMAILERNVNWLKKIWSVKGGSEQTVKPHAHTRLVNYELCIDGLSSWNLKLLSEMKIILGKWTLNWLFALLIPSFSARYTMNCLRLLISVTKFQFAASLSGSVS